MKTKSDTALNKPIFKYLLLQSIRCMFHLKHSNLKHNPQCARIVDQLHHGFACAIRFRAFSHANLGKVSSKCLMISFGLGMAPGRSWTIKSFQSQITVLLRLTLNGKKKKKKNVPVNIMTMSIEGISIAGP